jgi:hypothetical protein
MVRSIVAAGMLVGSQVGCATTETETQPSASVTSLAPQRAAVVRGQLEGLPA